MPSITSPEVVSQFAAIAGYSVGLFAEYHAQRSAIKNAEALQLEAATGAIEASDTQEQRHGRLRQAIGRYAAAPMAVIGFGAAGLFTYSMTQEKEVVYPPVQPKLEMVVDKSGATKLALGDTPSSVQIDEIVKTFIINKNIEVEALVASRGSVKSLPISKVESVSPFGDAPLEQASTLALDKAGDKSGTALIITNGNELGDTQELTKEAVANEIPVFIINVEGQNPSSNNLIDEQRLAKISGGEYLDANEQNYNEVAASVKKTLMEAETKTNSPSQWPNIEFAAVLLMGLAGLYRRRSKYVSFKSPKGE